MRIASGTVDQFVGFYAGTAADASTPATGLTSFTVKYSRNGGTYTTYTTPTTSEKGDGLYELLLDEDTTIDAGNSTEAYDIVISHGSMATSYGTVELYRPVVTEGNTLGIESDGDLTKCNLVATTTTNTDMVSAAPTAAEIDTELTNSHGAGSWAPSGGGSGAYAITVTVTDGTSALENASVRVTEGLNSYVLQTDASGNATFSLDAATYTVNITKFGYSWTQTTRTVTAAETGTLTDDLAMSANERFRHQATPRCVVCQDFLKI